ncbi:MAG: universal stress protein, partial [Chthoniobacterales bacterium]
MCGATKPSPANSYLDTADLVMQAGRPVLVVPQTVAKLDRQTAIVAWRNTRESRRALADALPLLATFTAVTLLHVRGGSEEADASLPDAQALLDGH